MPFPIVFDHKTSSKALEGKRTSRSVLLLCGETSSASKPIERLERCHVNLYHAYFVTSCKTHLQLYSVNYHKICRLRSIGVIIYLKCVLLSPESYRRSEFFSGVLFETNGTSELMKTWKRNSRQKLWDLCQLVL